MLVEEQIEIQMQKIGYDIFRYHCVKKKKTISDECSTVVLLVGLGWISLRRLGYIAPRLGHKY